MLVLLFWQYWTISEKRRAKALKCTSFFPLLRDLSRTLVFALDWFIVIIEPRRAYGSPIPLDIESLS
jgi:hypothetical protein